MTKGRSCTHLEALVVEDSTELAVAACLAVRTSYPVVPSRCFADTWAGLGGMECCASAAETCDSKV